MKYTIELKRTMPDKIIWLFMLMIMFFLTSDVFSHHSSFYRWITVIICLPFFASGAWWNLAKPDVTLINNELRLYGYLPSKTILLSLNDIKSVERHREFPIYQIPPLIFYLKDGSNIKFSTGGNTKRMHRIISFIEKETPLRVKNN